MLHGLCNVEAGKPAPAWNEPWARVSEPLQGQAGLLHPCRNQPVSPVPAMVLQQQPAPCHDPGWAQQGSRGLAASGWVAQVQGWCPGPPGPGGGRAEPWVCTHSWSKPPSSRPCRHSSQSRQSDVDVLFPPSPPMALL